MNKRNRYLKRHRAVLRHGLRTGQITNLTRCGQFLVPSMKDFMKDLEAALPVDSPLRAVLDITRPFISGEGFENRVWYTMANGRI